MSHDVFDLRTPLGYLFVCLGVLLLVAGMMETPEAHAASLGVRINLIWGIAMIAFGALNLFVAKRSARRRRSI